jgi:hypothetical protein
MTIALLGLLLGAGLALALVWMCRRGGLRAP